ncbi:MAG: hypothetical protein ACFE98_15150 [Candidatus Hermodarchaeota archaeon]
MHLLKRFSIICTLGLVIVLCGCTEGPNIMIEEFRNYTTESEEQVLAAIERADFNNLFYFDLNLSKLDLKPEITVYSKSVNGSLFLPPPPLQYCEWNSFYVDPARNRQFFYGDNVTSLSNLSCLYCANAAEIINISSTQMITPTLEKVAYIETFPLTHFIMFNFESESYSINKSDDISFLTTFSNFSYSGYRVEQLFEYTITSIFDLSKIRYHQAFLVNKEQQIVLGIFYLEIRTSIY